MSDEELIDRFLDYGTDLLGPYFADQDQIRRGLRLVAEIVRDDRFLWRLAGHSALRALAEGMAEAPEQGYSSAVHWAAVVEPLSRHLCELAAPGVSEDLKDGVSLAELQAFAQVASKEGEEGRKVPSLLAEARVKKPRGPRVRELACFAVRYYRNRHAHGPFPDTNWRERFEIIELVLLSLLSIISKHPIVERSLVFQKARLGTERASRADDLRWQWRVTWREEAPEGLTESEQQLAEAVNAALRAADLIRPVENEGPAWLAHPLIEDCVSDACYFGWLGHRWSLLHTKDKQALDDR